MIIYFEKKKGQKQGIELRPNCLKMTRLTTRPSGKLAVYVFLKTITLRYVFANQKLKVFSESERGATRYAGRGRTQRQGAAKVG